MKLFESLASFFRFVRTHELCSESQTGDDTATFNPGEVVETLNGTRMWIDTIHQHQGYRTYTVYDGKDGFIQLDEEQLRHPSSTKPIGFETNKKELSD